jgi:glutaredoxin-like protein NrdH|nr:MAG TPA: glutaredoxin-like protein [Caudoviricetes sp.]
MSITVYSKPRCQQCAATERKLDALAIDHAAVDVTEDIAALDYIRGLGYQQAPVVVVRDSTGAVIDHWSGFRPDRIKKAVGR